jgi:hypothetical protein
LWRGDVAGTLRALVSYRHRAADDGAREELAAYLRARAPYIPNYRERRRRRQYIGNGPGEKANDLIVARRQKRRGMHWGVATSDALAALRTLMLNREWDRYWGEDSVLACADAA